MKRQRSQYFCRKRFSGIPGDENKPVASILSFIFIVTKRPPYSSVTLLFSLVLLFAGFHSASAETPGQPGTNSTAMDSGPVSTETKTAQNPPSPAAQQKPKTGQVSQAQTDLTCPDTWDVTHDQHA